jgi:hypothetical protein
VEVIVQDGEAQDINRQLPREKPQALLEPGFPMFVGPAGERVDPAQEGPADATVDAVVDADLGRVEQELPGNPRHEPYPVPRSQERNPGTAAQKVLATA